MGFETFNPILNLGGIFVMLLVYFIELSIAFLLKLVIILMMRQRSKQKRLIKKGLIPDTKRLKRVISKVGSWFVKLRHMIFWGQIIVLVYESVLHMTISGLLYLEQPQMEGMGEMTEAQIGTSRISSFVGLLAGCMVFLLFFFSIYITRVPESKLETKSFTTKFGFMYEVLHLSKKARSLNIVFIWRRVIVCFVYIYLSSFPGQQIQFTMAQNLFYCIYLGIFLPYNSTPTNRKELTNEIFILLITVNLVIFTDHCPDPMDQYQVGGWMFCSIMLACIIYNLFFIVREIYRSVRLVVKKHWKRLISKFGRAKVKVQLSERHTESKANLITKDEQPNILELSVSKPDEDLIKVEDQTVMR